MRHSFLLFFVVALTAQAQSQMISFGVKGGIPLTEPVSNSGRFLSNTVNTVNTGRWTVGPTVEFHLPWRLSIEVDALYRKYNSDGASVFSYGSEYSSIWSSSRRDVRAWDIPFLLKYRFAGETVRPFISAGGSITHESRDFTFSSSCLGPSSCVPTELRSSYSPVSFSRFHDEVSRLGAVVGAGIELKYRRVYFSPELRYTRITGPDNNQVTLLFGLTF